MTDSCEIMFSVDEWLKTVEMEKFVVHGTFLQMKITLIICQKKENFYYKNNWWIFLNKSGNDTQPLTKRSDFNKRCLHLTVYTKKLEETNSSPFLTGSTNHGDQHRVLPVPGGNGKNPGDLAKNSQIVKKEEASKDLWSIGATRCLQNFGENLDEWLSRTYSILLQLDRSQLTAVYCNRREV